MKKANPTTKKTLKALTKSVAPKAKKSTLAMSKAQKTPGKAKQVPKSPVKHVVGASIIKEVASGVVVKKMATHTIRELQRYTE